MTLTHPSENPFFERGPISDPAAFFGRAREVAQALPLLRNGQSIAVVGPPRIGKSSFLNYLAHPSTRERFGVPPACVVALDCGGFKRATPEEIYARVVDEIREQGALDPALLPPAAEGISYRSFDGALRALKRAGTLLLLLLDAFEGLVGNGALHADFFSGLRALTTAHGVRYLTATEQPLATLQAARPATRSSPFFTFTAQIRLGLLPSDEARALVLGVSARGAAPYPPELVDALVRLAGPHPLLLQIAGFHAHGGPQLGAAEIGAFEHAAAAALWTQQWRALSADDQRALALWPALGPGEPAQRRRLADGGLLSDAGDAPTPLSESLYRFACGQTIPGLLQAAGIVLDPQRKIALRDGRPLDLNRSEYHLLLTLLEHAGQVLSEQQIEGAVWDDKAHDSDRVRTLVRGLRRAIGDDGRLIANRRGVGYGLEL